jgi:FKBP-type peptidyl-prolyl cis-trans isomerase SlpA
MIEKGNLVTVHYTGKLTDGNIFDSSQGKEPIKFQIGSGQIIPGFENAIMGKNVGDKVTVNIPADQAYGEVREDLLVKVGKEQLPGEVQVGQSLSAQAENGQEVNVVVTEINEDHVVIDGNHPFAGKELIFDIEVVDVQPV